MPASCGARPSRSSRSRRRARRSRAAWSAAGAARSCWPSHEWRPAQDRATEHPVERLDGQDAAAVADIKAIKLGGFLAWTTCLLVHLFSSVSFPNRPLVLVRWYISFATRGRGVRLITSPANADAAARPAAHPEPLMPRTGVSQVR